MNAAVWFGTAFFFMTAVWPGFFSTEMLRILPPSHSGAAAQLMLRRFCAVQYWCGGLALSVFVLEWLYAGKPLRRWIVLWVIGLLGLALLSGTVVQPRLARRHLEFYGVRSTPQQRELAGKSLRIWDGVVPVTNALLVLGLGIYVWEMTNAGSAARFLAAAKLRG